MTTIKVHRQVTLCECISIFQLDLSFESGGGGGGDSLTKSLQM